MQTAQLTSNGQIVTEFFAVPFLFRCHEKDRNPQKYPLSVIYWDLFFIFPRHFGVKMGDAVCPHYTAAKIYAISYLFLFFFIIFFF